MVKPFITIDANRVQADISKVKKTLTGLTRGVVEALDLAMFQYGEDILDEATQKAPIGQTGDLRASGDVVSAEEGQATRVVYVVFNIIYARIRDQGGTIRPVRAKRLFIPLRDGVRPGQPNIKFGVDFVLAKEVTQKGNGYLTATFDARKVNAEQMIGKRVFEILAAGA